MTIISQSSYHAYAQQISESAMQHREERIPVLAFKPANWQAMAAEGKVVEVKNGLLVETYADGSSKVLKQIAKPIPVIKGASYSHKFA